MSRPDRLNKRDIVISNDRRQEVTPFLARLKEGLAGRSVAWLAKESGVNDGTIRNYLRGAQPTIIPALQIANALGVTLDWLIGGVGPRTTELAHKERRADKELFDASQADWVFVPRYTFDSTFDSFTPIVRDTYPIPRDWLNRTLGTSYGLWITEMPGDDLPDVAQPGEAIICKNSADLTPGRAFLVGQMGQLMARRLELVVGLPNFVSEQPEKPLISMSDDFVPVGQILGRYGVVPVRSRS
ncbi:helix-turn-helix domain-containing protein [uncultured Brevundimonas sp.]|uniref:helix-turn-helix domain-containing protein n=1 Tax=uncultured Brevundimonas sp. TaxID=213418 RepID=UPI00262C9663|nr:helix-turn-helix transcriptional regulator [uncultured Brevundimonas sp.]